MTALAAALLAARVGAADAAPPPVQPPDLAKPPAVGPLKAFATPRRIQWRASNGLEVVLVEDRRFPMVTARLAVRAGSASAAPELAGLADAAAELLTDGTSRRNSREVAEAAQEYGGEISASAEADSIVLETSCLSEHFGAMMSLAAEVARFPSFPRSEVALRKSNMLAELKASRGESDFLASVAFYKKIWGSHPYSITAPTEDSIARLSRPAIVDFHRRAFVPRQAVLVLVGDVGYPEVRRTLKAYFESWKGPAEANEAPAVLGGHETRKIYLVDRAQAAQASIFMGNLAVREDHPSYFDLLLANQVLGGSFSSRLVQDIRETKGYTYRIGSRLEHRLTSSLFRVRTPVRTEVAGPALEAIFGHLDRLRQKGVEAEELEKAKTFLAGSFVRSMETQEGLADALLHLKLQRLPDDFYDTYVERVQVVTAERALRAAETFIRPEEMTVVVVGDASKLRTVLAKFSAGPVIPVDQDGN